MLISAEKLTKKYQGASKNAVDGVTFSVSRGEVVALVGHNGAGKSTLIDMVCGLAEPSSGALQVHLPRSEIGWCPQREMLDWSLTVRQNIELASRLGKSRDANVDAMMMGDLLGLSSYMDKQVETISGGELRRTMIARALVRAPGLAVLDEPTTGLDPDGVKIVFSYIRQRANDHGDAMLVSTHETGRFGAFCDRVIALDHGQLIADTPAAQFMEMGRSDDIWDAYTAIMRRAGHENQS